MGIRPRMSSTTMSKLCFWLARLGSLIRRVPVWSTRKYWFSGERQMKIPGNGCLTTQLPKVRIR